jgi:chromate transporter
MTLLNLVSAMFTYNALTFGNGPVMIPLLQKDLVDSRGVLSEDQLLYAFTIARVTPGQANVYVASIGYMLFGLVGALLTTAAIQLPGYLMLPLLGAYQRLQHSPILKNFTRGLTAASVGLIFAAVVSIARKSLNSPIAWVIFPFTFLLTYVLKWHPIVSLLVASAVGILLKSVFPGG